jgi:hypothetical protein
MKFALNPHVLMAHWVPGFLVVMAVRSVLLNVSPLGDCLMGRDNSGEATAILSIVVFAFLIGELLDAARDLILENILDKFQPLRWSFFSSEDTNKVENFKTSYYTYYVFDWNVSMALLVVAALAISYSAPTWTYVVLAISLVIFVSNAIRLRGEMKPLMEWMSMDL